MKDLERLKEIDKAIENMFEELDEMYNNNSAYINSQIGMIEHYLIMAKGVVKKSRQLIRNKNIEDNT